jgi:hypothetical protein
MKVLIVLLLIGRGALGSVADTTLQFAFEENVGQTDSSVRFLGRGPGYTLFLSAASSVLRTSENVFQMNIAGGNPTADAIRHAAVSLYTPHVSCRRSRESGSSAVLVHAA